MTIRRLITTVALGMLLVLNALELKAYDETDATIYLWKLINEARARPAAVVDAFGLDRDRVEEALGADAWILELQNGLPPLALHDTLTATATAHNLDMIERHYYSYSTKDRYDDLGNAWGVHNRIVEQGYDVAESGEILGIVNLYLYQEPMEAVEGIFENMVRDELDPDLGYGKNIFGKAFTEIGISFLSTQFSIPAEDGSEMTFNAYIVTADFARPVESRRYVLGNVYYPGLDLPLDELSPAKRLLEFASWSPDQADNSFRVVVNNITQQWLNEAWRFSLGSYQIQIPMDTYYSLFFLTEPDSTLLKRVVDYGRNVNVKLDLSIE